MSCRFHRGVLALLIAAQPALAAEGETARDMGFHNVLAPNETRILDLDRGGADLEFLASQRWVLSPMTLSGQVVARKID